MAIVRMNALIQKPYETKKIIAVAQIPGRNDICHVDHDVAFSFKVKHGGHANGDSWNDLKSLRNNKTIFAVGQIQAEITKIT